jgi:hypothetical protein
MAIASPYESVPKCILKRVVQSGESCEAYCAGFEYEAWRCDGLAINLMEWIIDYALKSDELRTLNHTNSYVRLRQAASRVYTSEKYKNRGEIGEIIAHAICRAYFATIPVAPRVNYLSASNDPVKAFDLVHVRYTDDDDIELWLGEAKFYKNRSDALREAIISIKSHIERGFLNNEKLLLGPQISPDIPKSDDIKELLSSETSLDTLIRKATFPILIAAQSDATPKHTSSCDEYNKELENELSVLSRGLKTSGIKERLRILLIYVPLGSKDDLSTAFHSRLNGLQLEEK